VSARERFFIFSRENDREDGRAECFITKRIIHASEADAFLVSLESANETHRIVFVEPDVFEVSLDSNGDK